MFCARLQVHAAQPAGEFGCACCGNAPFSGLEFEFVETEAGAVESGPQPAVAQIETGAEGAQLNAVAGDGARKPGVGNGAAGLHPHRHLSVNAIQVRQQAAQPGQGFEINTDVAGERRLTRQQPAVIPTHQAGLQTRGGGAHGAAVDVEREIDQAVGGRHVDRCFAQIQRQPRFNSQGEVAAFAVKACFAAQYIIQCKRPLSADP